MDDIFEFNLKLGYNLAADGTVQLYVKLWPLRDPRQATITTHYLQFNQVILHIFITVDLPIIFHIFAYFFAIFVMLIGTMYINLKRALTKNSSSN